MSYDKDNIFFIGIGGIGMSAIAQYFKHLGKNVCGYDKVETPLTNKLESQGIGVFYEDHIDAIPEQFKKAEDTIVVYTPAIQLTLRFSDSIMMVILLS